MFRRKHGRAQLHQDASLARDPARARAYPPNSEGRTGLVCFVPVILSFSVAANKSQTGKQFGGRGRAVGQSLLAITRLREVGERGETCIIYSAPFPFSFGGRDEKGRAFKRLHSATEWIRDGRSGFYRTRNVEMENLRRARAICTHDFPSK